MPITHNKFFYAIELGVAFMLGFIGVAILIKSGWL
jgi:Mg2+ and Co2+ transporter CorA